eukprot:4460616-Amphidinium_carterae.1
MRQRAASVGVDCNTIAQSTRFSRLVICPVYPWPMGETNKFQRTLINGSCPLVEADSIEVSGYSSILVGFALLPYVIYTLVTAFGALGSKQRVDEGNGIPFCQCIEA